MGTLIVVFGVVVSGLLVWPPGADLPERADAVAVLSGGAGDRLPEALALMRRDLAPVLVIPNGTDPKWDDANRLCGQHEPFVVVCPRPEPDTTRGEAATIDALAFRRDWDHVVVVTSRYHVLRARVLLPRCAGSKISVVGSDPDSGPLTWARHLAHEWLGLVDAVVLDRGC
jgi:uncharacterized SAM-binding protein YcdF (DUF218 family)